MKALFYEEPRVMHIYEVETPPLEPDNVLVRVAFSGICGSELSSYLGHNGLRKPPQIFVHELLVRLSPFARQNRNGRVR